MYVNVPDLTLRMSRWYLNQCPEILFGAVKCKNVEARNGVHLSDAGHRFDEWISSATAALRGSNM